MLLRALIFGIGISSALNVAAVDIGEKEDLSGDYAEASRPKVSSTPIELAVSLPKFPKKEDLQSFVVDEVENTQFALDVQNLKVDTDGIVRYSVVITTVTGLQNVFYEGIRCSTAEYKTYAFGTAQNTFQAQSASMWQTIGKNTRGVNRYRFALLDYYLCNRAENIASAKDEILYNLTHHVGLERSAN